MTNRVSVGVANVYVTYARCKSMFFWLGHAPLSPPLGIVNQKNEYVYHRPEDFALYRKALLSVTYS